MRFDRAVSALTTFGMQCPVPSRFTDRFRRKSTALAAGVIVSGVLMTLVPISASAQVLDAVTKSGWACPGNFSLQFGCTANDISVANTVVSSGETSCLEGETISITVELDLNQSGQSRYDALVWIGESGNDPRDAVTLGEGNLPTGDSCFVSSLPGSEQADGNGFIDLENGADQCNDSVVSSAQPITQLIGPIDIQCADADDNTELDLSGLITWQNNASGKAGSSCGDPGADPLISSTGFILEPNKNNPKCRFGTVNLPEVEVRNARLTIVKSYATGGQQFDFNIAPEPPEGTTAGAFSLTPPGSASEVFTFDLAGDTQFTITENEGALPAGIVLESATCDSGKGNPTEGITLSPGDDVTCTFTNVDASYTIAKTVTSIAGDAAKTSVDTAGDTIVYSIVVANTGNTDLTNVDISDNLVSNLSCTPTIPATLTVGNSISCSASYDATQAEVNAGDAITNVATASSDLLDNIADNASVPVLSTPAYTIVKTVDLIGGEAPGQGVFADTAGELINYSVLVTNTGNTDLTNVVVADPLVSNLSCTPASGSNLAPGATLDCSGTYTVLQSDLDNNGNPAGVGEIRNTASVNSNELGQLTDSKTVPVQSNAAYTIDKAISSITGGIGGDTVNAAGDIINYTVDILNTGNTTLTNVTVSDPLVTNLSCTPASGSDLAPGDGLACTGSYTVLQADLDADGNPADTMEIQNTATVDSDQLDSQDDDASVNLAANAAYTIDKTVTDVDGGGPTEPANEAGDVISYSIAVENTGNTTLTNVLVGDPLVSDLSCTPVNGSDLAPGDSLDCTSSYTVLQADLDANGKPTPDSSQIANTATVDSDQLDQQEDTETVSLAANPAYEITKLVTDVAGGGANGTADQAGEVITYSVVVSNTGNTTLTNVTASDPLVTNLSCTPASGSDLAPGASLNCSGSYTVQQSDLDNNGNPTNDSGVILNTATANSTELDEEQDSAQVTVLSTPSYNIVKSVTNVGGEGPGGTADEAGDVIVYSVVVTNDGTTSLTGVAVNDPLLSDLSCSPANGSTLLPGAQQTCGGSYTVQQSDLDNNGKPGGTGEIQNTATVSSNDLPDETDSATVTVESSSAYTIEKSVTDVGGDGAGGAVDEAGDTISYQIVIDNTGNTTVTGVTVTDPKIGTLSCSPVNGSDLAPAASMTCTGSYDATQAEVDAGLPINNIAAVNSNELGELTDTASVPVTRTPSYTIVKSVTNVIGGTAGGLVDSAGDEVQYQIVVTNNGNTTLTSVNVADSLIPALTCNLATPATLAPDDTLTCTGSYFAVQNDLNAGGNPLAGSGLITNVATASSTELADQTDSASVGLDGVPAFTLVKAVTDVNGQGPGGIITAAGQQITYQITVENVGNVDLTTVTVGDPLLDPLSCTPASGSGVGAGESMICGGSYTVLQADIDANGKPTADSGLISNTATANASAGDQALPEQTDSADVSLTNAPALTLDKTVLDVGGDGALGQVDEAGDIISYQLLVENTGNTTLNNVTPVDPLFDANTASCNPAIPATLAPGATQTCNGSYTALQSDLDDNGNPNGGSGLIENTATVSSDETDDASDSASVTLSTTQAYTIAKSITDVGGDGPTGLVDEAGDVISYQVLVENTGNTTLNGVSVDDPLLGATASCQPAAPAVLAPGEMQTCTGSYTVLQSDLDDNGNPNGGTGLIENTATVSSDELPDETDSASATVSTTEAYTIAKSVTDVGGDGADGVADEAGDVIAYEVVIENTGNTTLNNVAVSDPLLDAAPVCTPVAPATLAPEETQTCTGSYTVTQADIDNEGNPDEGSGVVENTATVSSDELPDETDSTQVTLSTDSAYTIAKTVTDVDGDGPTGSVDEAGDVISYEIVIENTGNTTLNNVNVDDPLLDAAPSCTPALPATLDPGDTVTCTGSYTVTQEAIDDDGAPVADSGIIENTATVSSDELPDDTDSTTVSVSAVSSYTIVKSVTDVAGDGPDGVVENAGDTIAYEIVIENTGVTTLNNVEVDDPLLDAAPVCTPALPATLNPGDSSTCTGEYTVTQADIDADGAPVEDSGVIENTATVSSDELPDETDSTTVSVAGVSAYTILKSVTDVAGDGPEGLVEEAGDTISYEIVVENVGTTTLSNVNVTDPLMPLVCTPAVPATLDLGASLTCTGTYVVTQSDLDDLGNPTAGSGLIENTATVTSDDAPDEEDTATVTIQAPRVIIEALAEVCINDVPYIRYDITTVGLPPDLDTTIRFFGDGGNGSVDPDAYVTPVGTIADQSFTGQVLWPGASVDEQGIGTGWPGWELQNGIWVEVDDGLVPSLLMAFEVNPIAEQLIQYPPRSANCIPPQLTPPPVFVPTPVPADQPWALLLMLMSILGMAWYLRPEMK